MWLNYILIKAVPTGVCIGGGGQDATRAKTLRRLQVYSTLQYSPGSLLRKMFEQLGVKQCILGL